MLLNYDRVQRGLHKLKTKALPPSPTTCKDVQNVFENPDVMALYGTTIGQTARTPFFKHAYASDAFSYCVFSSDNIIDQIKAEIEPQKREYLMDSTFKICPFGEFKQLLIIYIGYMEKV